MGIQFDLLKNIFSEPKSTPKWAISICCDFLRFPFSNNWNEALPLFATK